MSLDELNKFIFEQISEQLPVNYMIPGADEAEILLSLEDGSTFSIQIKEIEQ